MADPVVACVTLPVQMHYFTRADVFSHPAARAILLRLNMMPIYRPKDRIANMPERNQAIFSTALQRLEGGAQLGIFPEATHLDERRTRRFRHGAARFLLDAMSRPLIRTQGLEVRPMAFDFVRYEGYRSLVRIRIGDPIVLDDWWVNPKDNGANRIELSRRMRSALMDISVELMEGPLYEPHLAVCRFLEGHTSNRPDPQALQATAIRMASEESEVLRGWAALRAHGMPSPRVADDFAALGRLAGPGPTPLLPLLWRLPFWSIFLVTTGWLPRVIEPMMAKTVREVSFRTTFGIPALLLGTGITWFLLAVAVSLWLRGFAFGLLLLGVLRVSHALAMPLEDAWIMRRNERRAARHQKDPWVQKWCLQAVEASNP